MDFQSLVSVIRRRWRSVLVITLLAMTLNAAATFAQRPVYESRSQIEVRSGPSSATPFGGMVGNTYAKLVSSTIVAEGVIWKLGLDTTPKELAGNIHATAVEESPLIDIVVHADDPEVARVINIETNRQFAEYMARLQPSTDVQAAPLVHTTIQPSLNRTPVSPRVALNLIFGLLIGLLLGVATAMVREMLDRTFRNVDDLARVVEAPVLAVLGVDKKNSAQAVRVGGGYGELSRRSETFGLLRTNLQYVDVDRPPRCLLVTSAVPAEGKTTVATELAIAMAAAGRSVIILDADLRRQQVAPVLGLDPLVGLTTVLLGRIQLEDAIQIHSPSGVHVLATGAEPPNPTEILQLRVTRELIERLTQTYDRVIIDAPPVLPVADAAVLSGIADGTIVVVRYGVTGRDHVDDAAKRVRQAGGRVVGVVLNMASKRFLRSHF